MKTIKLFLVFLLLASPVFADDDPIVSFDKSEIPVVNETIRKLSRRIRDLEDGGGGVNLTTGVSGILPLVNGGTAAALVDPGADRILFWDDSAGVFTFLTASTGLTISGTTITSLNGLKLLATTTPSIVTETGDMTIESGKNYLLVFNLKVNTNAAVIGLRVNDISTASYKDEAADGVTEITIASIPADGHCNGQLYFSSFPDDGTRGFANGQATTTDNAGGTVTTAFVAGVSDDGTNVVSLEIVRESGTGTISGNVFIYELGS